MTNISIEPVGCSIDRIFSDAELAESLFVTVSKIRSHRDEMDPFGFLFIDTAALFGCLSCQNFRILTL